jgi:hypothetical protein
MYLFYLFSKNIKLMEINIIREDNNTLKSMKMQKSMLLKILGLFFYFFANILFYVCIFFLLRRVAS